MKDCKVNILGTEWTIRFGNEIDFPSLNGIDGYADSSTKEIVIDDMKKVREKSVRRAILKRIKKSAYGMKSSMLLWKNQVLQTILSISLSGLRKQPLTGSLFSPRRFIKSLRN